MKANTRVQTRAARPRSERGPSAICDPRAVVERVRECLPDRPDGVRLSEPYFAGNEWAYVRDCLDTGWVSSGGSYVGRFERMLAEITGARSVVATVNGTAALHVALLLAGVRRGDEVLVPAFTFVASANAVAYCGAIPHFVDSSERTLGVDLAALNDYLQECTVLQEGVRRNRFTGRPIRALVVVHMLGHPVEMDAAQETCERFGLALIEDAAEALGSEYKGRHVGYAGMFGTLSFNGNKTATTGGGGAILCDDVELGARARHLATTARVSHPWRVEHDEIGFNYRMPNINAALGCAQLENFDTLLRAKRALATRYRKAMEGCAWARFVSEPSDCRSNYWLSSILMNSESADWRDSVLELARESGIQMRAAWALMPTLPMYGENPAMDLAVARELEARLIHLPSSHGLVRG